MNRILIIDDSGSMIKCIIEGFKTFYGDKYSFLAGNPTNSANEAIETITKADCNIILLDHCLTNNGDEGLVIAEKIKNDGKLILSISILVSSSRELVKSYKKRGVMHFPGKNFIEIKKCLDSECECHLL